MCANSRRKVVTFGHVLLSWHGKFMYPLFALFLHTTTKHAETSLSKSDIQQKNGHQKVIFGFFKCVTLYLCKILPQRQRYLGRFQSVRKRRTKVYTRFWPLLVTHCSHFLCTFRPLCVFHWNRCKIEPPIKKTRTQKREHAKNGHFFGPVFFGVTTFVHILSRWLLRYLAKIQKCGKKRTKSDTFAHVFSSFLR